MKSNRPELGRGRLENLVRVMFAGSDERGGAIGQ